MNLLIAKHIFFKEILDTLRDKRTMIAMVGIPILLYPIMFMVAIQVQLVQQSKMEETVSRVVLIGAASSAVRAQLEETDQVTLIEDIENPEQALAEGDLDVVVRIDDAFGENVESGETGDVVILYDLVEPESRKAEERVLEALRELNKTMLETRVNEQELPEGFAKPIKIERENIASTEKATGSALGAVLAIVMVMMLGIGAFYPAVDLTAGEKERGTFETLLSTPATKLEIVAGKFMAVFSLSMITGLLNLISMTVTFYFQFSQVIAQSDILEEGESFISLTPLTVAGFALLLIPLAFFISAIMMSVAVMARSFKEAQNYVTPVFMAIIFPAMAVALPGIELGSTTQFIPITNIALLVRDLLAGEAQLQYFFTVFTCTCVYAMLSLVFAAKMFQNENVILSEDKGLPLTLDRRAFVPSRNPTLGTSLGILALAMLLLFYVGTWVQGKEVYSGLLLTQYLLLAAPVLIILWYIRVDIPNALNFRRPSFLSVIAVVIIILPWIMINLQLGVYQDKVLPIPEEFIEMMESLISTDSDNPFWILALLFIIAVSPAICEEILFRGVITSGLRRVLSGWATVLVVGILFGLFHMSVYRVLSTGLTGILLTYFVVRSGSIFLPMIAHFLNNAVAILIDSEHIPKSWVEYIETSGIDESGFPLTWIAIAVVIFIAGIVMFEMTLPKKRVIPGHDPIDSTTG